MDPSLSPRPDRRGDPLALLRLLQLADSGFPTGAFAFSNGLEGMVAAGLVRSEADLAEVLAAHVRESFGRVDGPLAGRAHRAAMADDLPAALNADALAAALKPVPVFREGSARVGRRLLASAAPLLTDPTLERYRAAVANGRARGSHPVAFGVVAAAAGVDEATAVLALGAQVASGVVAAAVRLGVVGQGAAQRLLAAAHPAILAAARAAPDLVDDDLGAALPVADAAGLRQPRLPGRVFSS
jgi:urease accessory protein